MGELEQSKFTGQINFNELFRVKGKKQLFVVASKAHKSGMIRMVSFLGETTAMVTKKSLVCLGDLVFRTELGFEDCSIGEVFNNLYKFYLKTPKEVPDFSDFLPNYDKNELNIKKALMLLNWFDELITKINELDGITQEDKE